MSDNCSRILNQAPASDPGDGALISPDGWRIDRNDALCAAPDEFEEAVWLAQADGHVTTEEANRAS